ncbi:TetR/AcrR family transcriptional regulator [Actinomadura madurae]|uniref:TetR/AcrR family transcriptional regulator n=1 Tax=Actinomadura madurae TaxID=1993 RepID=UPI0020D251BC|nr:TetR/AcrR family transcriptional regulator C-terminal ligand-binding domain-containing protein [Actinomadura madurae]MCQ0020228.1 TetR/AcrR family transcriptional regulator C-terminal ligand-binding domain-containing protein [Actinomadura madurae]
MSPKTEPGTETERRQAGRPAASAPTRPSSRRPSTCWPRSRGWRASPSRRSPPAPGVGKTTIYRRWPSKEALIVHALGAVKEPLPEPSGRSAREDLTAIARRLAGRRHSRYSRCFWNVTGSAEKYPDLYARYQQDVIEPRREVIRRVIRNGIETGELRADLDVEVVLSLLLGSLTARRPRETVPARLRRGRRRHPPARHRDRAAMTPGRENRAYFGVVSVIFSHSGGVMPHTVAG